MAVHAPNIVHPILISRSPFAFLQAAPAESCGLVVADCDGLGLATVLVRRGKNTSLAQRLRERFSIELPSGPYRTVAGARAFAGTGPGAWLATQESGSNAFSAMLADTIGDLASLSDQSDAYAVLRLSGPRVRETLSRLVPIDVHSRNFKIGDVAATVAAHVGATLWRCEDDTNGLPVFEVAVFRSFAESFWHALSESAAEFGLALAQPSRG